MHIKRQSVLPSNVQIKRCPPANAVTRQLVTVDSSVTMVAESALARFDATTSLIVAYYAKRGIDASEIMVADDG